MILRLFFYKTAVKGYEEQFKHEQAQLAVVDTSADNMQRISALKKDLENKRDMALKGSYIGDFSLISLLLQVILEHYSIFPGVMAALLVTNVVLLFLAYKVLGFRLAFTYFFGIYIIVITRIIITIATLS